MVVNNQTDCAICHHFVQGTEFYSDSYLLSAHKGDKPGGNSALRKHTLSHLPVLRLD